MTISNVKKQLITVQDIATGMGGVVQTRGSTSFNLDKVDLHTVVSSIAELLTVNTFNFSRARKYYTNDNYVEFGFRAGDFTGISADAEGSWFITNSGFMYPDAKWETNAGYTDTEIVSRLYPPGHVQRYGADPTGVDDSASSFNLATRSDYVGTGILVTDQYAGTVIVPSLYFRLNSAVWVHKGQHMKGDGEGGTNILLDQATNYGASIFRLGQSSVQSEFPVGSGLTIDTGDAGGLPPEISGMWTYGGPSGYPVIETRAAGATIHNLFMTSVGIGIKIDGGDIRVSNIQIDQAQTGIQVGGRSNQITNVLMFVTNIGVQTVNAAADLGKYLTDPSALIGCSDITFSDVQIFATKFYSIHIRASSTFSIGTLGPDVTIPINHSDISFNNFKCQQNIYSYDGFENFIAFILVEANDANNIVFNNGSFNNMNGPAIKHGVGISNDLRFNNCTFDGRATLSEFNQSLTPYAVLNLNDRMEFNNCTFKNLRDISNEVTVTATGADVGFWDPYTKVIRTAGGGSLPFDAGTHTITWTGDPEHSAMFAQGSSSATEVIIRGGTVINCLTPTATESIFVRIGVNQAPAGLSTIWEQDVIYEDYSMKLCNIPTVGIWYLYSDRYLELTGVGATTFGRVGGRKSSYVVNTVTDTAFIELPRIDFLLKRQPKNADVLTFLDSKGTWGTNNVTFLAGDNLIDGGEANFIGSVSGSEVSFVYEADPDLATATPQGNWISKVTPKVGADGAEVAVNSAAVALLGTAANATLTTSYNDTTAGRVLKVGDFGIGKTGLYPNVAALNDLIAIGVYSYAGSDPDSPTASGGSVLVTRHLDLYLHQFIFVGQNSTTYIRHSADNGANWSDWEYNYTTANIEFNKIGGPAPFVGGLGTLVNGYLMSGYAYSTSAVTLTKPISLVNRPSFFEEVSSADEFRIYGADGTIHGADIITPFSNVLFSTSTSSNGLLVVNITGLGSGLTVGEPVTLRALTANAGFIYS